ncbi:hypothetical protein BGZ61DRAFT_583443 [Ilyonectria robusta]|uniref:uncharacterized protein n=1 Tax=Ilyonectria robusta TaxID=1079257 RepID=UPI001E8E15B7|nr:uncharacterized protein BGZ61DRAFT_583443 [Ilyonectria robusta]KAH8735468.1 hypothetical protein BGZ61DRAFT_583443 [Ilyonectria robusta]
MAAPQPPPPTGPPGSFGSSAPGMPQHSHPHPHPHPHPHAAVAHYPVALGMSLHGYAGLEDAYRSTAAAHGLAAHDAQQAAFDRLPPHAPPHSAGPVAAAPPGGGQFGILAPTPVPVGVPQPLAGMFGTAAGSMMQNQGQEVERSNGQLSGKLVADPPDLEAWREKLFNVDETILLTHEEFETYFPHVDNVYSHRSTQRYKRKPFVSHYWDCRMKGRPPGTPKSDDPNKKKRKRNARERDLCDVKIKITEYFPGAQLQPEDLPAVGVGQSVFVSGPVNQMVTAGHRVWTIQRVNGNGGNGKGDGVAGPHKHTLEKSDDIKKNSVQRLLARQEKETRKAQKPVVRKATGAALATVKKHTKESDLKLYSACFCPFSQRVWIALEAKGLAYQYCEMDPFRRPAPPQLLEANPRGCVPAIRQGDWACSESGVILEFLEDFDQGVPLYPTDPRLKANCRLWIDHINTRVVPAFYALLQAQNPTAQSEAIDRLHNTIKSLVQAADEQGPFFLGATLSLVDIHLAPFALRLPRILASLCSWPIPSPGSRLARWLEALEDDTHVRATTSNNELYTETTELLARPIVGDGGV